MQLSHRANILYVASLERLEAAQRELDARAYPESMYFAGLAVECILQAVAIQSGAAHDARHDLPAWLGKCPSAMQDAIKGASINEWSIVVAVWLNGIRYLSFDGLLGYLRDKGYARGISGGAQSVVRKNAVDLLRCARVIQARGVIQWESFIKR